MTTPFTIFLISLIALIFLIVHKVMELHKGTSFVSADLRERGDEIILENVVERVKLFLAKGWLAARHAILSTRAVTQRVAVGALHKAQGAIVKLIERMKHAGTVRGGVAGTKKKPAGSVSFFLKHVSDEAKRVTTESAVAAAASAAETAEETTSSVVTTSAAEPAEKK